MTVVKGITIDRLDKLRMKVACLADRVTLINFGVELLACERGCSS